MPDIESDMSAIHRIDDVYALPGPRFFRLAWRLAAYQGCMRDRQMSQSLAARQQETAAATPVRHAPRGTPAIKAVVGGDPALRRIFSFGTGGG